MVVYTGILSFIQNEPDLVISMGHEITHAVAHHAQERISQAFVAQIIRVGADIFTSSNPTANNILEVSICLVRRLLFCYLIQETRNMRQIIRV